MKDWNLKLIYESKELWQEDLKSLDQDILKYNEFKGHLNEFDAFKTYAKLDEAVGKKITKLYVYAHMQHDLNQKSVEASEMYSLIYSKYNEYQTATSWINPELLSIGEDKLLDFCKDEELSKLKFNISKLFCMNKYVKDAKTEELMSNYSQALGVYNDLYNDLSVVDNKSHKCKISTGEVLTLNSSNFRVYLETLENQEDRRKVFETIFKYYFDHKATYASIYNGIMQSELAECKNRGYDNILESHLYHNNIDKNVFLSLIETTRNNTAPLKKYYELRKKYFKLETLHTYDRFLSFRKSKTEYSYENVKNMVIDACKFMGEDFQNKAKKVLEDGRVSVYSNDGKTTGGYSTSTYENGPFILLNHNDRLDDAFTIAHEAGHSIHTLYANESQPFETADYEIFVAEIASTFNEAMFLDYLLKNTTDKDEQIVLLEQAIDGLIATFYRQTLFANYEYEAHKLVESGIPVNADSLSNIMIKLYNDYYGIDLNNEKYKKYVWAYIPHFFHTPFYVYQYATSYAASMAIYQNVVNNVSGAKENYINMLKMGGSNYPLDIVKSSGVDLTKSDTFLAVVKRLDSLVDKLKDLLEE